MVRSTVQEGYQEAIGQSETFLAFQEKLSRVAPVNRPVLLLGERGTGKELAAYRLHYLSGRWRGAFVTINCAALPSTLIESELFGYEKGAFTGAASRRFGRFEAADGGSLFLDEIGHIPMEVQEKILSFEVLFLPPLRQRREDILLLANHFAARMSFELGREEIPQFSDRAERALIDYHWPGNIRELKNVIERAVYRSDTQRIADVTFDPFHSPYDATRDLDHKKNRSAVEEQPAAEGAYHAAVRQLQLELIAKALQETKYNQKAAASRLGLTYHQFRGLYRKFAADLRQL